MLRPTKPLKKNLTSNEKQTCNTQRNNDIIILPAHKVNATVVIDIERIRAEDERHMKHICTKRKERRKKYGGSNQNH